MVSFPIKFFRESYMGKHMVEHKRQIIWLLRGVFLLYLLGLFYLMFLSERYGRVGGGNPHDYNLQPFREIGRYLMYRNSLGAEAFFINIYGNILAFLPFGFLVPVVAWHRQNFLSVLLWSLAMTLSIEVIQLVSQVGSFDVDDMILNVTGGILGYVGYLLGHYIWRTMVRKGEKNGTR